MPHRRCKFLARLPCRIHSPPLPSFLGRGPVVVGIIVNTTSYERTASATTSTASIPPQRAETGVAYKQAKPKNEQITVCSGRGRLAGFKAPLFITLATDLKSFLGRTAVKFDSDKKTLHIFLLVCKFCLFLWGAESTDSEWPVQTLRNRKHS